MHSGVTAAPLLHVVLQAMLGWSFEPGIVVPLALLAVLYARGARVLGGVKHTPGAAWFAAGWLLLVITLMSPLHAASEALFSAHMVQHELLMVVAAPLLVLARPFPILLDGVPRRFRRTIESLVDRPVVVRAWRAANQPLAAWLIHGTVIWVWHIPALFQATLSNDAVHAAQHLCFLASAYLFWSSLPTQGSPERGGIAVLSLFTTAVHTGVLGALITFARHPWYPEYATRAAAWHMTALADQQLAGLIMWIPASVAYLIAALLTMRGWLRDSEWRVSRREQEAAGPAMR